MRAVRRRSNSRGWRAPNALSRRRRAAPNWVQHKRTHTVARTAVIPISMASREHPKRHSPMCAPSRGKCPTSGLLLRRLTSMATHAGRGSSSVEDTLWEASLRPILFTKRPRHRRRNRFPQGLSRKVSTEPRFSCLRCAGFEDGTTVMIHAVMFNGRRVVVWSGNF